MKFFAVISLIYLIKINTKNIDISIGGSETYTPVIVEFIDDYRLWLYEDYCVYDSIAYYKQMEKDLQEYSDFQTGKERDKRGKINDNWEKD